MELLELKNMSDMKNSLCRIKSRHYRKNNQLKYMAVENIHTEGKRLKKMKGASVTYETISREYYQTFKE